MTGQFPKRRETDAERDWRVEKQLARWKEQGVEPPEIREPLAYDERRNRDLTRGGKAA